MNASLNIPGMRGGREVSDELFESTQGYISSLHYHKSLDKKNQRCPSRSKRGGKDQSYRRQIAFTFC
jgi:hypothetical protein